MPTLTQFFPNGIAHYLTGGLVLGAGIALLFVFTGRIGGMSTVFGTTWSYFSRLPYFLQPRLVGNRGWRLVYAAGVVLGGVAYMAFTGASLFHTGVPAWMLIAGGFLVGFGARMANGCTSGHGVCGLAALDYASLVAVLTFMATAFATANLVVVFGVAR